ncbi:ribosomal RNA small subunit methyltransferase G [Thiohalobacter sp. COW1]|uniref:Ribosomal RNA small subunit methyltransferase G n=1 Tax=Thiohalobacter thiocyanaticus TaxID=585455 RepID=A0A1Z4VMB2_9GAMM|nr:MULTISPECIES: 16S rRNA (guanine(527)-N(7))-methyltransferase RsmG [Thiohalobacter]BAZ92625.1 ribosomal RNA small subunit methyltransferase G [Thiohalobacter thiocyanaticus]BCO32408.1 ribosomal RNA small subunit methyltransferase G [Thiohalobacter sp. COW1]
MAFARRIKHNKSHGNRPPPAIDQQLADGILALGLALDEAVQQDLRDFVNLLTKWNRVYNLTSVRKPQDMVTRHILDSLAALPYVRGPRILDIGTGAGLPGLVLALARPEWDVVVLDSSNKKLRFVRQVVAELELGNVQVEHVRIEDYPHAEKFDTVISRAFSSVQDMYDQGAPHCKPDGVLLAMKGVYPVTEIESLPDPGIVKAVHRLQVPGLDAERHIVEIQTG